MNSYVSHYIFVAIASLLNWIRIFYVFSFYKPIKTSTFVRAHKELQCASAHFVNYSTYTSVAHVVWRIMMAIARHIGAVAVCKIC